MDSTCSELRFHLQCACRMMQVEDIGMSVDLFDIAEHSRLTVSTPHEQVMALSETFPVNQS